MTAYAHSPSCNDGKGLCSLCSAGTVTDPELKEYLLAIAASWAEPGPGTVPSQDTPGSVLAELKTRFPPARGRHAEVDPHLWRCYLQWKHEAEHAQGMARSYETRIRQQARDAQVLTVAGKKVAVRVIRKIENASWTEDYFRRSPLKGQHDE